MCRAAWAITVPGGVRSGFQDFILSLKQADPAAAALLLLEGFLVYSSLRLVQPKKLLRKSICCRCLWLKWWLSVRTPGVLEVWEGEVSPAPNINVGKNVSSKVVVKVLMSQAEPGVSCRLQPLVTQFCFSLGRFNLSCSMVSWRNGRFYVLSEGDVWKGNLWDLLHFCHLQCILPSEHWAE